MVNWIKTKGDLKCLYRFNQKISLLNNKQPQKHKLKLKHKLTLKPKHKLNMN